MLIDETSDFQNEMEYRSLIENAIKPDSKGKCDQINIFSGGNSSMIKNVLKSVRNNIICFFVDVSIIGFKHKIIYFRSYS